MCLSDSSCQNNMHREAGRIPNLNERFISLLYCVLTLELLSPSAKWMRTLMFFRRGHSSWNRWSDLPMHLETRVFVALPQKWGGHEIDTFPSGISYQNDWLLRNVKIFPCRTKYADWREGGWGLSLDFRENRSRWKVQTHLSHMLRRSPTLFFQRSFYTYKYCEYVTHTRAIITSLQRTGVTFFEGEGVKVLREWRDRKNIC